MTKGGNDLTLAANTRVVVVGAGIIGCSAAWHLLIAGARNVTVVDAVGPGQGTTSAGAGFIGYCPTGTLILALTAAEAESSLHPMMRLERAPSGLRTVRAEEVGEITGGLVKPREVHSAVFNPHGIQLAAGDALPFGQPRCPQMLKGLLEQQSICLERLFPPLRGSTVSSWLQGVPCYTPDHNLMVGRVPHHPGILAVGGDNETGVTHGPGLGRLLAEMVLQRTAFVDPQPFRLERFAPEEYPTEASVEKELAAHYAMFAEFVTRHKRT